MAIREIKLTELAPKYREFCTRAQAAADKKNLVYAISLIKGVVIQNPGCTEVRNMMRKFVDDKGGSLGFMANMFAVPKVKKMLDSDPLKALAMCEDLLAQSTNAPAIWRIMVEIGTKLDFAPIQEEALERLLVKSPKDVNLHIELADFYLAQKRWNDAVRTWQKICNLKPDSRDYQNRLKDVTFQANKMMPRKAGEGTAAGDQSSILLQLEDGFLRDKDQAKLLIDKFVSDLKEKDSLDIRRKLSSAYMVMEDFDSAIRELEYVAQKLGALDPKLDKMIEKAYLAKFDQIIGLLEKNPRAYQNPEEQIADLRQRRENYRWERAQERLKAYPDDPFLHYDYAQMLQGNSNFEEAIAEYTKAGESLQLQHLAQAKIAECLVQLGRTMEAIDHYEKSLELFIRADRQKLEIMYDLAGLYESEGITTKALNLYKEIMNNNVRFKDVAAKIEVLEGNLSVSES